MMYRDFLETVRPLTDQLRKVGFEAVLQARPTHVTESPLLVYSMPLAEFQAKFPDLAEGDIEVDYIEIVATYDGATNEFRILLEGDAVGGLLDPKRPEVLRGPLPDIVGTAVRHAATLFHPKHRN